MIEVRHHGLVFEVEGYLGEYGGLRPRDAQITGDPLLVGVYDHDEPNWYSVVVDMLDERIADRCVELVQRGKVLPATVRTLLEMVYRDTVIDKAAEVLLG